MASAALKSGDTVTAEKLYKEVSEGQNRLGCGILWQACTGAITCLYLTLKSFNDKNYSLLVMMRQMNRTVIYIFTYWLINHRFFGKSAYNIL